MRSCHLQPQASSCVTFLSCNCILISYKPQRSSKPILPMPVWLLSLRHEKFNVRTPIKAQIQYLITIFGANIKITTRNYSCNKQFHQIRIFRFVYLKLFFMKYFCDCLYCDCNIFFLFLITILRIKMFSCWFCFLLLFFLGRLATK